MPFTLSHGAAALPFRRMRLVFSAVLVGTLAPDFEYFLRLSPGNTDGHTVPGIFLFTVPAALIVLWIFHAVLKRPVVRILPEGVQRRLANQLQEFRFPGAARFGLIIVSILLGIATHVVWDAFTHSETWPYHHWAILRELVSLPIAGDRPFCNVLQHVSSLLGIAILGVWVARWYRTSVPTENALRSPVSPQHKIAIWLALLAVALSGATVRVAVRRGISLDHLLSKWVAGTFVVTFIALLWWELVVYAFCFQRSKLPLPRG